jgi:hypothetical protein
MSSKEIYVSTDVEADGPIPGPNSMLSFGSAAYTAGKELIGTFSANLETLPGATADPKTGEWWAQQPEAWAACRQELEMPRPCAATSSGSKPFLESRYSSATRRHIDILMDDCGVGPLE